MPDNMIPGLDFGAQGSVLVNTLDNIYTVDIEVKFAVIEFSGLISLRFIDGKYPIPDSIVGSVGGEPGIPLIPTTPIVYITKGGLGFENLYDTVTGNFKILPPLKLMFQGSVQVLKVIEGSDITLELSARGVKLSGDLTILKLDLFKDIHGEMAFGDGEGLYVELGGGINVFDVIVGEVSIGGGIDNTYNGVWGPIILYGRGSVDVQVPTCVPVVGGQKLAGAEIEVSTKHAYAAAKFLDIPVSIEYAWGDSAPSFDVADASDGLIARPDGISTKEYYNEETGDLEGVMTFGTNIRRISSSKVNVCDLNDIPVISGEQIILAALDNSYSVAVNDRDAVIFEVEYNGDVPELEVYKPDGSKYELVENGNYRVQEISPEESESGLEEKRAYITALNPANGEWIIKADKDVDVSLLDVAIPPSIDSLSVELKEDKHTFEASWEVSNLSDEKMAFYLCENEEDAGEKLVDDIDATKGSYTYTLDDSIPTGNYYIRSTLYKDETNYNSRISENYITVVDENQPSSPENLQVDAVGNGIFKVDWEQEGEVDGYFIEIKDENGDSLEGVGAVEVEGDSEEAYVGGTFTDTEGNPLGMIPGNTYMVSMVSYKKIDDIKHYSESVSSESIYLPKPNPPELTFDIDSDKGDIKVSKDINGNNLYTVNTTDIDLSIDANMNIDAQIILNDEELETLNGENITKEIELQEGENLIQINAANEDGDTSIYGVTIKCDTTAPELKVDEPETVDIDGEEKVKIRGVAELGSSVTVNGKSIEVDEEGIFETYLASENVMKRDLTITAEDRAGNVTTYNSIIYNEAISDLDHVEIRAEVLRLRAIKNEEDSSSIEAYVGKTLDLNLYCIDNEENEYLMDSDDVEWSILVGEGVGNISESGELTLKEEGNMIVKGSYYVSDEYAFEDAVIINVVEDTQGDDDPDDNEDEFKPIPDDEDDGDNQGTSNKKDRDERPSPNENASYNSSVDDELERILKNLAGTEDNMKILKKRWILKEVDTVLEGDDKMRIKIPGQDLGDKAGIGIWKIDDKSGYEKKNMKFISDIYEIALDQEGLLEKPATLEINYDPDKVENPESLAIYWFNEDTKEWEYVGGKIDLENNTVTVELNHFSKYSLIYNSDLKRFKDIAGRWSESVIYKLALAGVINGVEKNDGLYYEPMRHINRQEFIKLLLEAEDIDINSNRSLEDYTDSGTIQSWAVPYVREAISRKWFTGSKELDGMYVKPLQDITRGEAAVIVGRLLAVENNSSEKTAFSDDASIPDWAKVYVKDLNEKGIITGYSDNTFKYENPITREEAATIILKLTELTE